MKNADNIRTEEHIFCPHCDTELEIAYTQSPIVSQNRALAIFCPECGNLCKTIAAIGINICHQEHSKEFLNEQLDELKREREEIKREDDIPFYEAEEAEREKDFEAHKDEYEAELTLVAMEREEQDKRDAELAKSEMLAEESAELEAAKSEYEAEAKAEALYQLERQSAQTA